MEALLLQAAILLYLTWKETRQHLLVVLKLGRRKIIILQPKRHGQSTEKGVFFQPFLLLLLKHIPVLQMKHRQVLLFLLPILHPVILLRPILCSIQYPHCSIKPILCTKVMSLQQCTICSPVKIKALLTNQHLQQTTHQLSVIHTHRLHRKLVVLP